MTTFEQLQQMVNDLKPKSYVRWIKNRPALQQYLLEKQSEIKAQSIVETLYCVINNCQPMHCPCGNPALFNTFTKGYRQFCSLKCPSKGQKHSKVIQHQWSDPVKLQKMLDTKKATCLEKYGFDNAALSPATQQKQKETCQKRYGADSPFESTIVRNKIRQANQERYGVDLPLQNASIRGKANATFEQNHGEKNHMQLARKALFKKYNGLNPFAVPEIQEKIKKYWLDNWGLDHPTKVPHILAKSLATLKLHYGVDNANQIGIPLESLAILQNAIQLEKLLIEQGLQKLSSTLNVRQELIVSYHNRLGLSVLPKTCRSLIEEDVFNFLNSLSMAILRNDRKIISPFELDFVIPEKKIAIEFNGLYWHSTRGGNKSKNYHANKYELCCRAGYQLITIWEDEWREKCDVIQNHIKHLLHQTTIVQGARTLKIKEISLPAANVFLNQYHIQGAVISSKITLGAFFKDKLVSVITTQQISDSEISLTRWGQRLDASRPGLLSKFLKHLNKNYNINKITTIADLRWSQGKSYLASGFTILKELPPDYQYTDYVTRDHKFNLRKERIKKKFNIDIADFTENQLCEQLGFDRVWDCGKLKFVWTVH